MKQKDRAKIKLLWRVVLNIMDKIDEVAKAYTSEEIEADIIEAVTAARNLELQYVCSVEDDNGKISP